MVKVYKYACVSNRFAMCAAGYVDPNGPNAAPAPSTSVWGTAPAGSWGTSTTVDKTSTGTVDNTTQWGSFTSLVILI